MLDERPQQRSQPENGCPEDQLRGRVLLAEDGRANRYLIQRMLEKAGLTVDFAEDGLQAVQRAVGIRCKAAAI